MRKLLAVLLFVLVAAPAAAQMRFFRQLVVGDTLLIPRATSQPIACTADNDGALWYDTDATTQQRFYVCEGDSATWKLAAAPAGGDTNAATLCSGDTTYLSGENNCNDISSVYLGLSGGTLTGELTADDLGIEFTEGDTLTNCSTFPATGGGIFYDDSEGKFKKCQENVLTDLDTGGGGTVDSIVGDDNANPTTASALSIDGDAGAIGTDTDGDATMTITCAAAVADGNTKGCPAFNNTRFSAAAGVIDVASVAGITGADADDLSDDNPTALSGVTTMTDGQLCEGNASTGFDCDVATISDAQTPDTHTHTSDTIGRNEIDEQLLSIQTHATDCTALTCDAASDGEQCFEQDAETYYICDGSGTPAWQGPYVTGAHTADEVGTLTSGNLCINDGSVVNCTVNDEAELETALGSLDVVTVTAGDISTANLMTALSDEGGAGTYLEGDGTWSAPGGSGDVTAVGSCADGDCFTDGDITSGTTLMVWEGNVADAEQVTFAMSSAEPADAYTLTFPDETGTICTTGSVCSNYQAADTDLDEFAALTAVQGSIIIGDATPDWSALPIGGSGDVLLSSGTTAAWDNSPQIDLSDSTSDLEAADNNTTQIATTSFVQQELSNDTTFALLAGRAGGQTIIGGTGAGDDITLQTTSNASKGSYILTDLDCSAGDLYLTTNASGVISCGTDDGGGSVAWSALTAPTNATTFASDGTSETVDFDFQATFTTGDQFQIRATGTPSGGRLFSVENSDADVVTAHFGDGTNGVNVDSTGTMAQTGTGSIVADDTDCGTGAYLNGDSSCDDPAGDVTGDLDALQVTDLSITSEAQGDFLMRGASNWERFADSGTVNQFIQSGGGGGDPAWASLTLASAQFVNQGTTTQVLHGNATGNPSWGSIVDDDVVDTITIDHSTTGTLKLDQDVAPTAEGQIAWDATNDEIEVGDTSGTQIFKPVNTFTNGNFCTADTAANEIDCGTTGLDIDAVTGQTDWGSAATKTTADLTISGVEVDFENGASPGYPLLYGAASPVAVDCNDSAEYGRIMFDSDDDTTGTVKVCTSGGWKDVDDDGPLAPAVVAQGDLIAANSSPAWSVFSIGSEGSVLTVDPEDTQKIQWSFPVVRDISMFTGADPNARLQAAITACSGDCVVGIPADQGTGADAIDLRRITANTAKVIDGREHGAVTVDGAFNKSNDYAWKSMGFYDRFTTPDDANGDIHHGFQFYTERAGGGNYGPGNKDKQNALEVIAVDRGQGEAYGAHIWYSKYGYDDGYALSTRTENYGGGHSGGGEGGGGGIRIETETTDLGVVVDAVDSYSTNTITATNVISGSRLAIGRWILKTNEGTYTTGTAGVTGSTVTGDSTNWVGTGSPCDPGPDCDYYAPADDELAGREAQWCIVFDDDINDGSCTPWTGGDCGAATFTNAVKLVYAVTDINSDTELIIDTWAQGTSAGYGGFAGTSAENYTLYQCSFIESIDFADGSFQQSPASMTITIDSNGNGETDWTAGDTFEVHPHHANWGNPLLIKAENVIPNAAGRANTMLQMTAGIEGTAGYVRFYEGYRQDGYYSYGNVLDGNYSVDAMRFTGTGADLKMMNNNDMAGYTTGPTLTWTILGASGDGRFQSIQDTDGPGTLWSVSAAGAADFESLTLTTALPYSQGGTGLTAGAEDEVMVGDAGTAWVSKALANGVLKYDTTADTFAAANIADLADVTTVTDGAFCQGGTSNSMDCDNTNVVVDNAATTYTTGTQDFSAVAIDIESGASGVTANEGELAIDTSNLGQLVFHDDVAARYLNAEKEVCKTIESLTTADDDVPLFWFRRPVKIQGVTCTYTGANDPDIDITDEAGNVIFSWTTAGTACATSPTYSDASGDADGTLAAGEGIEIDTVTAPDLGSWTVICFTYTETAQ